MGHLIDVNRYAHWKPLEPKSGNGPERLLSDRGIELLYEPFDRNVGCSTQVACEDHCKWYQLYLLRETPRGLLIGDLHYHEIEAAVDGLRPLDFATRDGGSALGDHCVNPDYLDAFCNHAGVYLSNRVRYMVQGMWWENRL